MRIFLFIINNPNKEYQLISTAHKLSLNNKLHLNHLLLNQHFLINNKSLHNHIALFLNNKYHLKLSRLNNNHNHLFLKLLHFYQILIFDQIIQIHKLKYSIMVYKINHYIQEVKLYLNVNLLDNQIKSNGFVIKLRLLIILHN
jgi:hypothetical protein